MFSRELELFGHLKKANCPGIDFMQPVSESGHPDFFGRMLPDKVFSDQFGAAVPGCVLLKYAGTLLDGTAMRLPYRENTSGDSSIERIAAGDNRSRSKRRR